MLVRIPANEMGLVHQLYLLTWKNFTLRRRHKLRQIAELVWPLLIFLILVLVRGRQPPEHMHECHFNGKAMPSAGLLPFVQSLLCYSSNTCHRNPVLSEASGVVDSFNTSGLSVFYQTLQSVATNQTLMDDLVSLWNLTQPLPGKYHVVNRIDRLLDENSVMIIILMYLQYLKSMW